MRRTLAGAGLVLVLLTPALASARELTPLEKAARRLMQQQLASVPGNTATGMSPYLQPFGVSLTAAALGNSTPPLALGNSLTPAAAGNTLTPAHQNAPVIPDGFNLTATATADRITLSWTNTGTNYPDFKGYQLTRGSGDAPLLPLRLHPATAVSFVDLSATAQTDYSYQVTAIDAQGQSLAASRRISARLGPVTYPPRPMDLDVSVEDEAVRLKWRRVQPGSFPVAGYVAYRYRTGEPQGVTLMAVPLDKETYLDTGGNFGVEYLYSVAAVDQRGNTGIAATPFWGHARPRNRNAMVLMSTAYRGMGHNDTGLNVDLQFTYYIGTLYGEVDPALSKNAVYLDPISLWLLNADGKYVFLDEIQSPVSLAVGAKGGVQLFAGQQSQTSGNFTFSSKTQFSPLWGTYLTASRTFGETGVHAGYLYGPMASPVFFLSRYLEPEAVRHLVYAGTDFPLVRRMNVQAEVLVPLETGIAAPQHPVLINTHVDRLFNFNLAYLHWDQGWSLLGYFDIRFTIFPGQ